MKKLLTALQEGRFVELPETNKEKALNYLANLIEAMPDLGPGTDVAGAVLARETQFNTGIGMGWACPHSRSPHDGEVICAAGWSPAGIDYGACDHKPVHFVVMYYVPDVQKNVYLKEISSLARAIQKKQGEDLGKIQTLAEARNYMLDLVSSALETQGFDAKARMIHLEAKQAATAAIGSGTTQPPDAAWAVIPLSIIVVPGARPVVLSQDPDLVTKLESGGDLESAVAKQTTFEHGGYKILFRGMTAYQARRSVYDCLALKTNGAVPMDKSKL